jgi:hypothetical protein
MTESDKRWGCIAAVRGRSRALRVAVERSGTVVGEARAARRRQMSGAHCAGAPGAIQRRDAFPQPREFGAQVRVVLEVGAGACNQQDVDGRKPVARAAKTVAGDALDAVAPNRLLRNPFGDRKAQARTVELVGGDFGAEMARADAAADAAQSRKILGFEQTRRARKGGGRGHGVTRDSRLCALGGIGAAGIAHEIVCRIRPRDACGTAAETAGTASKIDL